MRYLFILFISLLLFSFSACKQGSAERFKVTPMAYGKAGEIYVVADEDDWKGPLGEKFREYYESLYLVLPQPEPIFKVKHIDASKLGEYTRQARSLVFLGDLEDGSLTSRLMSEYLGEERVMRAKQDPEFTSLIQSDRWADGQSIVYLFGKDEKSLLNTIDKKNASLISHFQLHDASMVRGAAFADGKSIELENRLKDKGINMEIPGDYFESHVDSKTVWFRKENPLVSSNIIVHVAPYTESTKVTQENIIAIRDSIGKALVSSQVPGSYMKTDSINLPVFYSEKSINGFYALEARGIWRLEKDFMGGPFLSYMIYDPTNQQVAFIDGFCHAPGESKKPYMKHLESIFSEFAFQ